MGNNFIIPMIAVASNPISKISTIIIIVFALAIFFGVHYLSFASDKYSWDAYIKKQRSIDSHKKHKRSIKKQHQNRPEIKEPYDSSAWLERNGFKFNDKNQ